MNHYLVKTCWVLEGGGFEDPWPIFGFEARERSLTAETDYLRDQFRNRSRLPNCKAQITGASTTVACCAC